MNEEELRAYEATQAEKAELGIPPETKVDEPETPPQEEEKEVETEQVPAEEVEKKEERVDPKEYKDYKTKLREELEAEMEDKIAKIREELSKKDPDEEMADSLEEEAKKLAEELDFDEKKTLAILKAARRGVELSEEDRQALRDVRELKEQKEAMEQEKMFNEEWNTLPIKSTFPNATDEQLAQAKQKMDELAHSEEYHEMPMDYILFKEKATFDKLLFSPKQKTFESGRKSQEVSESDDEFPVFRPDMTPAEFERFEKRRAAMDDGHREKMLLRTTDDAGRSVEKWI